ncbi:MAG: glycoside hydrolase family 3 [Desulfobulbus propionicus]|nr:MAG: glycoside hydrolase family 3 [Desulfobulbus propionicus]
MFLVGFRGEQVEPGSWLERAIVHEKVGGVVLFDRNIDKTVQNFYSPASLRKVINSVMELSDYRILIAVDQEGGNICRLKSTDGFQLIESAEEMSGKGLENTRQQAGRLADMLREYNINLNFAPVVDLNSHPANPVIGKYGRSFGRDANEVTAHAQVIVEEHRKRNIGCCLKHFPGHGSSGGDSHLDFVDISVSWRSEELIPYEKLIKTGHCDAIMTGHLVNVALDKAGLPATLSPEMITGLLRRKLGFKGVVFSDDMQMAAVTKGWSYKKAVQLAVVAGIDMLIIGNNLLYQENAVEEGKKAIVELLEQGVVPEQRIKQSLTRIHEFTKKLQEDNCEPAKMTCP